MLDIVNLRCNDLTGPVPEFSSPSQIRGLLLNSNRLSSVPTSIGEVSRLVYIHVGKNEINGKIPPEIGQCHFLAALYMDQNAYTGTIPIELGQLSRLETLDLASNNLIGLVPTVIASIPTLGMLAVSLRFRSIAYSSVHVAHQTFFASHSSSFRVDWLHATYFVGANNI